MKCKECNHEVQNGVCFGCGLVNDEYENLVDEYVYSEETFHHGAPRDNTVIDLSVLTTVNLSECKNPDLRRALMHDGYFGWDIKRVIILNREIKVVCNKLRLDKLFIDDCYYFLRKYRNKMVLTGFKLEFAAAFIVYLFLRMSHRPVLLADFGEVGYNTTDIYNAYMKFSKTLQLEKKIKRQDPSFYVSRYMNKLFSTDPKTYRIKFELSEIILKLFYGIYGNKSHSVNRSIAALIYCVISSFKHPFIKIKKITQKEISDLLHLTEVTLREYMGEIETLIKSKEI